VSALCGQAAFCRKYKMALQNSEKSRQEKRTENIRIFLHNQLNNRIIRHPEKEWRKILYRQKLHDIIRQPAKSSATEDFAGSTVLDRKETPP
jgi:hypothetical protein